MMTRAQLKYEIYQRLMKSAATKGFYTDDKCNSALQESLDYIAGHMFLNDEGWLHKLKMFDTEPNMTAFPIPKDMAMIVEVRFRVGNVYIPVLYDQDFGNIQWGQSSGVVQFPSKYRVVDNTIYFNPPVATGGSQTMQIEYMAYPRRLQDDGDFLASQFDRAMCWYAIYRSCSALCSWIQQYTKPWEKEESQWYDMAMNIISMRNQQSTPIRDFSGY